MTIKPDNSAANRAIVGENVVANAGNSRYPDKSRTCLALIIARI